MTRLRAAIEGKISESPADAVKVGFVMAMCEDPASNKRKDICFFELPYTNSEHGVPEDAKDEFHHMKKDVRPMLPEELRCLLCEKELLVAFKDLLSECGDPNVADKYVLTTAGAKERKACYPDVDDQRIFRVRQVITEGEPSAL